MSVRFHLKTNCTPKIETVDVELGYFPIMRNARMLTQDNSFTFSHYFFSSMKQYKKMVFQEEEEGRTRCVGFEFPPLTL